MDNSVPGGVYLFQINERVSCGACCGLYNVADVSSEGLTEILIRRTEAFERIARDVNSILDFKKAIDDGKPLAIPFPDFHHCPYLGLVGERHSRVGCLLHPQANGNNRVDFRGLSYYGGMACSIYFCPSYSQLSATVKWIVGAAAGNWYRYGLIITETLMLSAFFLELERRLDQTIRPESVVNNKRCFGTIQRFFTLKFDWPFRPHPDPGPANYFFKDQLYGRPAIDYNSIGVVGSKYDTILRELVSSFDTYSELQQAERILEDLIEGLVSQISAGS
jgi:hypothetical protein